MNSITIQDRIQAGKLWVKNDSNPRRILVLTMIDRGGRVQSQLLPDTPHPLHLSNTVTRDMLENCQDLYAFVQSGALQVVDEEASVEYYKRNTLAAEAVRRAYMKVQNKQPIASPAIAATEPSAKSVDESVAADTTTASIGTKRTLGGVNVRVQTVLSNKDMSQDDKLFELANIVLQKPDLTYILNNAEGRVQEFARRMLSENDPAIAGI